MDSINLASISVHREGTASNGNNKDWYDVIDEKIVADNVLDRTVHQSLGVELFGEPLKKQKLNER